MFGDNSSSNSATDSPFAAPPSAPTAPTTDAPNLDNAVPAFAAPTPPVASTVEPTNDDLLSIKQEALQQLTPLVGHLEQTPEEKFRTLMMMIQASDDHTKLQDAFDTAQKISDDKARAQALLDIINEINYFTQQHNS